MSLKIPNSFVTRIFLFGWNSLFQLISIIINYYLITLQRVLLSLLIIFGEVPVSRHEPISERKKIGWENGNSESGISVFGDYEEQTSKDNYIVKSSYILKEKRISNFWKIYIILKQIITVFFKTIFSYVEFPEESVNRISISSFSRKEILPIGYLPILSKNPMETSDYQTDVEFIDDECF
ncbi:Hypothetical protein SRAE_1000193300 [Strongyloides ratti]|uniref:Uncharacterized protein n=1 Tax=Strongyloides ratti TaxID=34506 RepID=A0A090L868_STRRB|nr:Hypothetical protein SRAE_1000193300 [Strongyloides ratti]CEF63675.1 Hypothetical protein SRAE_1000193300 [Strongyloides ratti]